MNEARAARASHLRDEDALEEPLHALHTLLVQLTNEPNILIRSCDSDASPLPVHAVILVRFSVPFMIAHVVYEYAVVVPASLLVEWMQHFWEVTEKLCLGSRRRMTCQDTDVRMDVRRQECRRNKFFAETI
jgi:hypothetical protein